MDTATAKIFVESLRNCAVDMMSGRQEAFGLDGSSLMALCRLAEKCEDYLMVNTGVKHIFGLLAAFSASGEE